MTAAPSLLCRHSPSTWVALGCPNTPGLTESKTCADLLLDAARVAARLPQLSPQQHVLLVFRQDRYAFTVGLLAAWSRGYTVCLPPNQRGATIGELLKQGTPDASIGVLLHDTSAAGHLSVAELLADRADVPPITSPLPPTPAARVMTSGSTGRSVAWDKTGAQLFNEVEVLAGTFGMTSGLVYAVTVPPSHLYGLLFGVLLPLATGSSFTRNTPLLPGEIAATIQDTRAQVLVSVPTHLRAARSLSESSLASLERVFSSAGPLPEETARVFTARHHKPITEIFGSTETGGIAWRHRNADDAWQPLANVAIRVNAEQLLVVSSPFTNHTSSTTEFTTSDRVQMLPNGRFEHLGRQDGVVKIGGQRLSVPAMEECLIQHPEVEDVAIIPLEDDVRGHRLLAAVCGPPHLEEACRVLLSAQFELSTLPRRFVFLDKLPREASGKLMRSRVLRLFGLDDEGTPVTKALTIQSERTANVVRSRVHLPSDYIAFSGHFDQYPVLAGATQIQYVVLPVLRTAMPEWQSPSELRRIKFTGRIEPGDTIDVELLLSEHECQFRLDKGGKPCSSGTLIFGTNGGTGA